MFGHRISAAAGPKNGHLNQKINFGNVGRASAWRGEAYAKTAARWNAIGAEADPTLFQCSFIKIKIDNIARFRYLDDYSLWQSDALIG